MHVVMISGCRVRAATIIVENIGDTMLFADMISEKPNKNIPDHHRACNTK